MSWWQTVLVAFGSAAVGGVLTGAASWMVVRQQERSTLTREVRMALGVYFGALVLAVHELSRMPEDAPDLDVVARLVKSAPDPVRRWFEANDFVRTERGLRATFGDVPFRHMERIVIAYAPLQILPLPSALEQALDDSLTYVGELGSNRSSAVKERWPDVRDALLKAIRDHVADAGDLARALQVPSDYPNAGNHAGPTVRS
jgi:hypothetical protein